MADYDTHSLSADFGGIHHFSINNIAVIGNYNAITINDVSYDGNGYDITFTIDNLADDVKDILRSKNGNFYLEFGRMSCAGTEYIASYQSCSTRGGKKFRSVKRNPNHYFVRASSFDVNIPSNRLNTSNTFSFYLSEDELVGLDRGDWFKYRYKSRSVAQTWTYLIFRVRIRMVFDIDNHQSPYRLNSDEIVTYCTFN